MAVAGNSKDTGGRPAVRATISFPAGVHELLQRIATEKKVSLAWVVRDAVDTYIDKKWPLFERTGAVSR